MTDAKREHGIIANRIGDGDWGPSECRVKNEHWGLELLWTRNGYQWVGGGVDIQLLKMMRDTINEALATLEREDDKKGKK